MQAFPPKAEILKWTGSARPFESNAGPPPGAARWGAGLRRCQVETLTPLEAMNLIYEWKKKLS